MSPRCRASAPLFNSPIRTGPRRISYWLIAEANGTVDVCSIDPEVDLYATTDLRTMTAIWLGLTIIQVATESDRLLVVGDTALERTMPTWLGLRSFAAERKLALARGHCERVRDRLRFECPLFASRVPEAVSSLSAPFSVVQRSHERLD